MRTAETFYASCCGVSCGSEPGSQTLVVAGGCWMLASLNSNHTTTQRAAFVADVHDNALALYGVCPSGGVSQYSYTATPTTLTLFDSLHINVFTKVH